MLTLREAAALLAADGSDALPAIAAACGCDGPLLPLPEEDRAILGLSGTDDLAAASVWVARGPDPLRTLVVRLPNGGAAGQLHDVVSRVAGLLVRRAPQLAWLCLASHSGVRAPAGRQLIVATWSGERYPPRIAALVVDPDALVDSDAEALAALASAAGLGGSATHARWLDILGRESLTRRFYRSLGRAVDGLAASLTVPSGVRRPAAEVTHTVALLYASRLLFLAFLEAKGWLDGDPGFLAGQFAACVAGAGGFHRRVLRPLFFGTLNTPLACRAPAAARFGSIPFLNGGLFSPTAVERRLRRASFSDAALGVLVGDVLGHYRFTAREEQGAWSETAIDPEMLGKSFEALMMPHERRATGAYYTPQALVVPITIDALAHALSWREVSPADLTALLRGQPADHSIAAVVRRRLDAVRVIDPACGSGAFLVHALDVLADLAGRTGDPHTVSERRRRVLTRSIFGVDINPIAVWLCELRLWLAVVIDTTAANPAALTPLPNLDRNIRVGDALAGGALTSDDTGHTPTARSTARIARLRERYARSRGPRKQLALRGLDALERQRAIDAVDRELARVTRERVDAVTMARGRDLFGAALTQDAANRAHRADLRRRARLLRRRLDALRHGAALPFTFAAHFADAADAGGFDVVVGNPPWVRPHAVPVVDRERQRREFVVCRHAGWSRGAVIGNSGAGFGAQVDVSALFVERALSIVRPGGVVALLVPAKLWRSLAGGGVRQLIRDKATVLGLEDWSGARTAFDATAYPSLVLMQRSAGDPAMAASASW